MNPAPHHLFTGDGLWLQKADDPSYVGLPLSDVPLIVEGLLLEAKQLADAGAPTATIEEILDHVDALREGRGW